MKSKLTVHLLFMYGHIEILLEDRNEYLTLHLRRSQDMSKIPPYDLKHQRVKNVDLGYIWDGEKLYYKVEAERIREIRISNMEGFQQTLDDLLQENPDEIDLHLSLNNAKALISNHSAHEVEIYTPRFYIIDRWSNPQTFLRAETFKAAKTPYSSSGLFQSAMDNATDRYSFDIEADPDEIIREWNIYYDKTLPHEHLLRENCAAAAQWFLTRFVQLSPPKFWAAPVTLDQIAPYLYFPSFIPLPVHVPKRVFETAKFQIQIRHQSKEITQLNEIVLNLELAQSGLLIMGSTVGIILASNYLSRVNCLAIIPPLIAISMENIPLLFSAINRRVAKGLVEVEVANNSTLPNVNSDKP